MNREELLKNIEHRISARRLKHTMGVEKVAIELAKAYGSDQDKASLAALLHDIAKPYTPEEAVALGKSLGIEYDEYELFEPALLHGPLGAAIAGKEFGITDRDILCAIEFHTTGRKNMTLLEKIIYIADLIEPSRDFEGLELIQKLSKKDLDAAMQAALRREIVHVMECSCLLYTSQHLFHLIDLLRQILIHILFKDPHHSKLLC